MKFSHTNFYWISFWLKQSFTIYTLTLVLGHSNIFLSFFINFTISICKNMQNWTFIFWLIFFLRAKINEHNRLVKKRIEKKEKAFKKQQIKTFDITDVAGWLHFSIENFMVDRLLFLIPLHSGVSYRRLQILYCSIRYICRRQNRRCQRWSTNSIFFGKRTFCNCNVFTINCKCEFLFTLHFILHAESSLCLIRCFCIHNIRNLSCTFCYLRSIHSTFLDRKFSYRYSQCVFSFLN